MHRVVEAALIGVACAVLGSTVSTIPEVLRLEESAGLGALFQLRGPRPAPDQVVVVSLDKVSSDTLGLPNDPEKWPRSLHAELIDRLAAAGAAVIAFDVLFDEPDDPAADARLGEAARAAGNVVFTGYLKRTAVGTSRDGRVLVTAEQLLPPIPPVTAAAAAVAPFPLPVVPVKVSQFWTYKTTAGSLPTFPTAIFQVRVLENSTVASSSWLTDLKAACPGVTVHDDPGLVLHDGQVIELARSARECLTADRQAALAVQKAWQQRLAAPPSPGDRLNYTDRRSLFEIYTGADSRYLNYYGPPRSIRTIPYPEALRGANPRVSGKVVLIGFSEQFQPEQKDGFHSVYTDDSGLDLSGVEIAATAVGNLLDGTSVRPLAFGPALLVTGLWGLLAGAFCRLLQPATAVVFAALSVPLYGGWALWVFDAANTWLPLFVPLAIQVPAALVLGFLAQYRQARNQRQMVLQALGSYLPPDAVKRLMLNIGDLKSNAQLLYGTCLATDGEQYTRLAETLTPDELAGLMNAYYEELFAEVEQAGGVVTDVVGDAMMAIWTSAAPNSALRARACHGALAVAAAVARFNAVPGRPQLPTRIGLHSGPIRLGNIGGAKHVHYRAVGDIVNTASRIEGLNKLMGTRVLVSADTLDGVTGFETRELGTFLLAGKSTPVVVHELQGQAGAVAPDVKERNRRFGRALATFRDRDWRAAGQSFGELLDASPDDLAVRFYVELCARFAEHGPDGFVEGAVRILSK